MARSADPMSYTAVAGYVYWRGDTVRCAGRRRPGGARDRGCRADAERSSDDLALILARMVLGLALVHRHTDAERDRGQQVLAEVRDVLVRQGTDCSGHRS